MSERSLEEQVGKIFPEEMAGVVNDMYLVIKRYGLPEEAQGAILWELMQSMSMRFEANIYDDKGSIHDEKAE